MDGAATAVVQDVVQVGWSEARRNARLGDTPGPLPFNWRCAASGMYEKLGYTHDALGKDWRSPTVVLLMQAERPKSTALFSDGEMLAMSKKPDELLNPPAPTFQEKRAAREVNKAEKERVNGLTEGQRLQENKLAGVQKFDAQRASARQFLAVRAARHSLGYGYGMSAMPNADTIQEEHMTLANKLITAIMPVDNIKLSQDDLLMWAFNSIPLGPIKSAVDLFYRDRFHEYRADSRDVFDMLSLLEGSRFTELPPEELPKLEMLRGVFFKGPFEYHDGWKEKAGMEVLVPYIGVLRSSGGLVWCPTSDGHEGCEVELSALGMTLFLANFTLLKSAMTAFGKLLPNRNKPPNPDRMKQGQRRQELRDVFSAVSQVELKKASKVIDLPAGSKKDMIEALIKHFAPERKRKRAPVQVPAEAVPDSEHTPTDDEEELAR